MEQHSTQLVVLNTENKPTTTSLIVAERFGKQHKHVLEKIEQLECSEDFLRSNFRLKTYQVRVGKGRGYIKDVPYYELT